MRGNIRALRFLMAGILAAAGSGSLWAADGVIKIGAVLPVTGKESKIGGAYKQATEYAVKEVNDAGGVKVGGKPMKIELTLLDDT
ncbi:MAG TPA: ABC transporter substrate-binding protein, partial [Thermoanaerobaculia bacterium]|nr:ABC transporter substrate-binding protein [Thermoanaerobaculia bacterium]